MLRKTLLKSQKINNKGIDNSVEKRNMHKVNFLRCFTSDLKPREKMFVRKKSLNDK